MKRLATLFLIFPLLCGCSDYAEIDSRTIVSGIAVDKTPSGYSICCEITKIHIGSGANISADTVSASGDSIMNALRNILIISGEKLYFGHTQSVIFGPEMEASDIMRAVTLFSRQNTFQLSTKLFTSPIPAADILNAEPTTEMINSFEIAKLMSIYSLPEALECTLDTFIEDYLTPGTEVFIPRVTQIWQEKEHSTEVSGISIFKGSARAGFLDIKYVPWFSLARNELKSGLINLDHPERGSIVLEIEECSASWRASEEALLTVDLDLKLVESDSDMDILEKDVQSELADLAEQECTARLGDLFSQLQHTIGSDAVGVGAKIAAQDPLLWADLESSWAEIFPDYVINTCVNARVISSGRTTGDF